MTEWLAFLFTVQCNSNSFNLGTGFCDCLQSEANFADLVRKNYAIESHFEPFFFGFVLGGDLSIVSQIAFSVEAVDKRFWGNYLHRCILPDVSFPYFLTEIHQYLVEPKHCVVLIKFIDLNSFTSV